MQLSFSHIIFVTYLLPLINNIINDFKEHLFNLFYNSLTIFSDYPDYNTVKGMITRKAINVNTMTVISKNYASHDYFGNKAITSCGLADGKYIVRISNVVYRIDLNEKQIKISTYFWNNFKTILTLIELAKEYEELNFNKSVTIYKYSTYGGWIVTKTFFPRKDNTIILAKHLKQQIYESIDDFKNSEPLYKRLGIPHKKGVLFHGIAGTGKTSLISCIAKKLNTKTIYNITSISKSNEDLIYDAISKLDNTVILFEDIDRHFQKDEKGDLQPTFTLNKLMNVLDGLGSPENCIIILTANNVDVLPKDLIRPGRIDLKVYFGYSGYNEIIEYTMLFYEDCPKDVARQLAKKIDGKPITIAMLQKHFLKYKNDVYEALLNISELDCDI